MSAYRRGWLVLAGLVVMAGLLFGLVTFSTAGFVFLCFAGAVLGAALHPHPVRLVGLEAAASPTCFSVVGSSVGFVALSGLLGGVGASGTAAVLAVVAIAWVPLRRRRGGTQREPVHRPADVHTWSNADLCRAWRWSFVELQRARDSSAVARIADERCLYLDEVERRDPRGFALWISAGAPAAGDPLPYLGLDSDRPAS